MKKISLIGLAVFCCLVGCLAADGGAWMNGAPTDKEPGHPLRGGGSHSDDRRVRSASRHSYRQSHKSHYVGFRISCQLPEKKE